MKRTLYGRTATQPFSFETAWQTLQGFEVMNMIRKGQVQAVNKGDVMSQVALVAKLFGVAA